jgi:hypothetical protein
MKKCHPRGNAEPLVKPSAGKSSIAATRRTSATEHISARMVARSRSDIGKAFVEGHPRPWSAHRSFVSALLNLQMEQAY